MVSSSGLSRLPPGGVQGEQPGGREEFVWPAYPVFLAVAATRSFLLLAQHRPKPSSRERVDVLETRGRVLEVVPTLSNSFNRLRSGVGQKKAPAGSCISER